jgi:sec-independent protein translocase protein TatB
MFDIGWTELALIAVVRKMAAEFQGQFQEAMREAEMADLKKSFDEVKEAAAGFRGGSLMTSLEKDVTSALRVDDLPKPVAVTEAPVTETATTDVPATSSLEEAAIAHTEAPIPETFTAADADALASQPLAIVPEAPAEPPPVPQDTQPVAPDAARDVKAS